MAIEKVKLKDFLRKVAAGNDLKLKGVVLFIHPKTEVLLESVQVLSTPQEVVITYRHRVTDSNEWESYPGKWSVNPEYTVSGISIGRRDSLSSSLGPRQYLRIESRER